MQFRRAAPSIPESRVSKSCVSALLASKQLYHALKLNLRDRLELDSHLTRGAARRNCIPTQRVGTRKQYKKPCLVPFSPGEKGVVNNFSFSLREKVPDRADEG